MTNPFHRPLRCALKPLVAALLLGAAIHACAADLVVIVSARSPVTTMRADQVANIFLGQVANFPGGGQAVALDQQVGSDQRNTFYAKVAAKTPALIKAYWSKMIFTGRGQPPNAVATSAVVRKMVAENQNLVGYIDRSALDASVKVVLVVH